MCQGKLLLLSSASCKKPRETGDFYLNIYFSEGAELNNKDNSNNEFKFFKATYTNSYENEAKMYRFGEPIKEEDEDEEEFSKDFKEILRIK